ncbi:MAG: HIT family protein [Lachnospiraceae bacterium]|jgi:histidine triad (HIT) family protein|nr:HIT family protein [Lachnospiraceae bacterium]MEE3460518.1 HIT family protein [Lachnospiraceae bacterium]
MVHELNDDCIFCKITKGEIPSEKIYEDDDFLVMLDINPASKGHAVILPKTHAENIFTLPDEYLSKVLFVARKTAKALKETLGCDGVNILQNNGEAAGQTVFHYHVHIIPRWNGDNVGITWKQGNAEGNHELAEEVRKHI